ncbi:MAG: hypothetical protein V1685_07025 [Parcubacteria group bacterium]
MVANNRLWLVYRPTGKAVFLGKRMATGWGSTPDDVKERIEALFDHIAEVYPNHSQDDLCLAMEENQSGNTKIETKWQYTEQVTSPLTALSFGVENDGNRTET